MPLDLSIWLCILLNAEVSSMTDFLFPNPVILRNPLRKPDPVEPHLVSMSERMEGVFDCGGDFSERRDDLVTRRRSLEEQEVGAVDSERMEVW